MAVWRAPDFSGENALNVYSTSSCTLCGGGGGMQAYMHVCVCVCVCVCGCVCGCVTTFSWVVNSLVAGALVHLPASMPTVVALHLAHGPRCAHRSGSRR